MTIIEKITVDFIPEASNPGLIDMFLAPGNDRYNMGWFYKNFHSLYADEFLIQAERKGIAFGKVFGIQGIPITQLLSASDEYQHMVFEISDRDFIRLPKHYAKKLLTACNVLITEYIEGGSFFGTNCLQIIKNLGVTPLNLFLHTSNYNFKEIDIPNCTVLPTANLFALIIAQSVPEIYRDKEHTKILHHMITTERSKNEFKYHAFLSVRKPRESRIKLIADLHVKKVLTDCLWSMAWSRKDGYLKYEFNNTPNIKTHQDHAKRTTDKSIKSFLRKYEKALPKSLPDLPPSFEDMATNNWMWATECRWGVSLETFTLKEHPEYINPMGFLTEKTFRLLLNGITPLILGSAGADQELRRIGFRIPDFGWDELSGGKRREAVTKFITDQHRANSRHEISQKDYIEDTQHNMSLFQNKTFLVNLMLTGLKEINV